MLINLRNRLQWQYLFVYVGKEDTLKLCHVESLTVCMGKIVIKENTKMAAI